MQPKKVLFVCVGNICRSPMAEAFARTYGSDVIVPMSAGLSPATLTSKETRLVLRAKNIELGEHLPRPFRDVNLDDIDLVVNMSGYRLPKAVATRVEDWPVQDPFGEREEVYERVCAQIEMLVMNLILRIRTGKFDGLVKNSAQ